MRSSTPLPALDALKDQAKRLRGRFAADGQDISHSRALELIAAQYGFRDWNTLHAAAGNRPAFNPWTLGARVRGHYLGQPFDAEVRGVQALSAQPGRYRITLHFDTPIREVVHTLFSAYRQRVSCNVDESGRTLEHTSDGRPHLELEW